MKLLFVCSRNRLRSPTAEAVCGAWPGVEAWSAGIRPDAEEVLTLEHLTWADEVMVMEDRHRQAVERLLGALPKAERPRVVVLGIRDIYDYMDPELVRLIEAKVGARLGRG